MDLRDRQLGDDNVIETADESRDNPVLDEIYRVDVRKRDDALGQDYFSKLRDFWSFRLGGAQANRTPSFRPQIMFSDLQWMCMQESGDLTDNTPIFYLPEHGGGRREGHEKALRGQWYVGEYGLSFFHGTLWSLLAGTGFLMMVHDWSGRGGRGNTLLKWVDTESVVVDAGCTSFRNWQRVIHRSRLSLDEIRRAFPETSKRLPRFPTPAFSNVPRVGTSMGESPDHIRLPPGPMQQMSFGPLGSGGDTRIVEYFFLLDDGRRQVKEIAGGDDRALFPETTSEPMYPNGRLIIRCDKVKLYDGPNWAKRFPFIPIQVHPPLAGFWAPPPVRLVVQLQEIAQTLARQNIENVVRLNNGMMLINETMGVQADSILGLPGERVSVKSTDGVEKAVKILTPPVLPEQASAAPMQLLNKMKVDFGFDDARRGKAQAGNQSAQLMDAVLTQASGLTYVRGRLLQPSIKLAIEMVYETMLQYQNPTMFPVPGAQEGALEFIEWSGAKPEDFDTWELMLDEASVRPMSSAVARQYAILLRNMGVLPVEDTLEWLGVPGAKDKAARVKQEQEMQMLVQQDQRGARRRK